MTLIELFIAICFIMPIPAAYASASHMKLGFIGHALAVALGLVIGFGFAWAIWASVTKLVKLIDKVPKALQGACGIGCLLLFGVWTIVAEIVGAVLPPAILRLIF
jgi:hypothetical protein